MFSTHQTASTAGRIVDMGKALIEVLVEAEESVKHLLGFEDQSHTMPDYNALTQYALTTLYPRTATSNITIDKALNTQHTLVMVAGSRKNFLQVASLGTGVDDHHTTRRPLYNIEEMAGTKNIINLEGEDSVIQRKKIKPFLSDATNMDITYQQCKQVFHELMSNWKRETSFQEAMTYYCINIIGNRVLGIPQLSWEDAKLIREAGKQIGRSLPDAPEFVEVHDKLDHLNSVTAIQNQTQLLHSDNYIKEKANVTPSDNEDEIRNKLLATHGASNLLVESNLSTLMMAGIYYVHQSEAILQGLQKELAAAGELTRETIENLPYLNCVYKEALRFISPTAVIVRETSHDTLLKIADEKDAEKPYSIHNQALMFAPIRRLHHDKAIWNDPETFDPARFADGKMDVHLMPFSLGTRSCPAASHFNPVLFKTALIESLAYHIQFDKPLETIPEDVASSRWVQEYYADVEPVTTHKHSLSL